MPSLKDDPMPQEDVYWEDDEGFRSTFLRYFSREDAAALRGVGQILFHGALESHASPQGPGSFIRKDLRAARADLLFLQGFLASLGETSEEELHDPSEYPLCQLAAKFSRRVGELAEDIAKALGLPGSPGRQP